LRILGWREAVILFRKRKERAFLALGGGGRVSKEGDKECGGASYGEEISFKEGLEGGGKGGCSAAYGGKRACERGNLHFLTPARVRGKEVCYI